MMQSPFSRIFAGFSLFSFAGSRKNFFALTLLGLLLTSWAARAEDPESDYTAVYINITAGDDYNKTGDYVRARAKYIQAQQDLQALQQSNPNWNTEVVSFRLSYLAEKIAATQQAEKNATAKAEAAATAAKAAAAAVPKVEISLVDAGAEPRKALRLHPHVGEKQTVVASIKEAMTIEAEGKEAQTMQSPEIKATIDITVKEVSSNGDITYEAVLSDLDLADDTGDLGAGVDKLKASLAAAKGIMNIVTVSDRGIQKSSRMQAPADSDPKIAQNVDRMKNLFPDIMIGLPEEAVGVGAKWTVSSTDKIESVTINEADTAEIVSIEGDVVTTKLTVAQSGPPQKIEAPGMPGLKLTATHVSGKGGGEVTFDLGQVMPSKGTEGALTEFTVEMDKAGEKKSMTRKVANSVTFEAK
jgi:hypothetical protein